MGKNEMKEVRINRMYYYNWFMIYYYRDKTLIYIYIIKEID